MNNYIRVYWKHKVYNKNYAIIKSGRLIRFEKYGGIVFVKTQDMDSLIILDIVTEFHLPNGYIINLR